jgi:4-amino-4-deoxy-L-arabinose transferase-like glycosyltransferase
MAALLIAASAYWLWFGLTQRSITGDDGFSILAAQGILEHGYPKLPSGLIYHRAYGATYLLAGSIGLFGLNDFGIMLPSLLMALGSLWLVFRFAALVLGSPRAGAAAAALLLALQSQTVYATSARMYMALEYFMLLSAYCAWRGYVNGERRWRGPTGLAMAMAVLSHQQGGVVLAAIPLAALAARWLAAGRRPAINWRAVSAGYAALCAVCYATVVYKLPGRVTPISAHSGRPPDHVALGLDPQRWLSYLLELESTVPFGVLLVPVIVFLLIRMIRNRAGAAGQGLVFASVMFALNLAAVAVVVGFAHWRFLMPVLPFYALLLGYGFVTLVTDRPMRMRLLPWMAGWAALVFAGSAAAFGPAIYATHIRQAYGLPCRTGTCSPAIEREHAELKPAVGKDDLVISSNPQVTSYYLGRADGFLRQRVLDDDFTAFESPVDEYQGIRLIDTAEELETLRRAKRRVWVVTDYKIERHVGPRLLEQLDRTFAVRRRGALTVYVNGR